jgi:hypothetical protein
MPALCTATNYNYLNNAIILAKSCLEYSYSQDIFIYYFDISESIINKYKERYTAINFIRIPKLYDHSYDPLVFWYKTYAIKECIKNTDMLIYSDATNLFLKNTNIANFFNKDCLLLPYNSNKLLNKYWTTKKCFEKLDMVSAKDKYQYWAGFQCYRNSNTNLQFVTDMYNYMCDPEIALPGTNVKHPDSDNGSCFYHRCDQSVLSLLIYKYNKNQAFNAITQKLFGDHQTFKLFDHTYDIELSDMCLSPRHTKQMNLKYVD